MKGYRTIVFNLIMAFASLVGLQLAPETALQWAGIAVVIWAVGGVLLRVITTTPAFQRVLPPEVAELAGLIVANAPKVAEPFEAGVEKPSTDDPASGGATITGPPEDLISLATSITNALSTVQAVHARVTSALQAAHSAVGAALPTAVIAAAPPTPEPAPAAAAAAAAAQ